GLPSGDRLSERGPRSAKCPDPVPSHLRHKPPPLRPADRTRAQPRAPRAATPRTAPHTPRRPTTAAPATPARAVSHRRPWHHPKGLTHLVHQCSTISPTVHFGQRRRIRHQGISCLPQPPAPAVAAATPTASPVQTVLPSSTVKLPCTPGPSTSHRVTT